MPSISSREQAIEFLTESLPAHPLIKYKRVADDLLVVVRSNALGEVVTTTYEISEAGIWKTHKIEVTTTIAPVAAVQYTTIDQGDEGDNVTHDAPTLTVEKDSLVNIVTIVVHEHGPDHGNWGIDALATIELSSRETCRLAIALLETISAGVVVQDDEFAYTVRDLEQKLIQAARNIEPNNEELVEAGSLEDTRSSLVVAFRVLGV